MNILQDKLAKKYGQAFVNIYGDSLDIAHIEIIEQVGAFLKKHREILFYVQLSVFDEDRSRKGLDALLQECEIGDLLAPLVELLTDHKRMVLFGSVLEWIAVLALEAKNIMKFTIESYPALTEQEQRLLNDFLKKETGKQILSNVVTNSNLIAGLRVYSETLGFERSIRKQLRTLEMVP
jgi:F0F1-type ATP synthase delta subunit